MTTDITELAQREKFEAWFEGAEALPWGYLKNRRTSDSAYQDPDITDMWVAWKADGAELVEALEKAQQRIAELEDAEQKLCVANVTLDARAELAERRLAEMESRTVTVKPEDADGVREEGNQFLVVRHPGKVPVIKHPVGHLEDYLLQILKADPLVTIDIVTHRYYGAGGQFVKDADEYLHEMGIKWEAE